MPLLIRPLGETLPTKAAHVGLQFMVDTLPAKEAKKLSELMREKCDKKRKLNAMSP